MGGALLFTAMLFAAFGFGIGWWLRDVTFKTEDERERAKAQSAAPDTTKENNDG